MSELWDSRRTYTVEEAARILGIGRNTAYRGASEGWIPAIRVGRRLLVPRDRLERLLAGRDLPSPPDLGEQS